MTDTLITEEQFTEMHEATLGDDFPTALDLFQRFGPYLSWHVSNIFCHAVQRNLVAEVIERLEAHWQDHLQWHCLEARGKTNKSDMAIHQIYVYTLGLSGESSEAVA